MYNWFRIKYTQEPGIERFYFIYVQLISTKTTTNEFSSKNSPCPFLSFKCFGDFFND